MTYRRPEDESSTINVATSNSSNGKGWWWLLVGIVLAVVVLLWKQPWSSQAADATATPAANVEVLPTPAKTPAVQLTQAAEIAALKAENKSLKSGEVNGQASTASGGGAQPTETPTPDMIATEIALAVVSTVSAQSTNTPNPTPVPVTPTPIVVRSSAGSSATVVNTQLLTPVDAPVGHENCPTDREMQDAHGFTARGIKPVFTGEDVVWDPCKWTLQANGAGLFQDVPLLPGYAYNITLPDDTVVIFYGAPGLVISFKGATIRYVKALPDDHFVRNACSYIAEEMAFGLRRDPQYLTEMGNVNCPDMQGFNPQACPANAVHAAALIGGQPQYWTMRDWSGGADVYVRKEHWTRLRYPGFGTMSVWYKGGPVEITGTQNTNVLGEVNPDEASFHCP